MSLGLKPKPPFCCYIRMEKLIDLRRNYGLNRLSENQVPANPVTLFDSWFALALENNAEEAYAMTLATHGTNGFPQARIVLLRAFSQKGFVFYTNYKSAKGVAMAIDNKVSLTFYWPWLERQVRIEGYATKTSPETSDRYFASRPLESRISAIISPQSQPISSRMILDKRFIEAMSLSAHTPPVRPENWGGYVVVPENIEFWQGGENRLHDRLLYTLVGKLWKMNRLAP